MRQMFWLLLMIGFGCQQSTNRDGEEWIKLFNGHDLNDWHVKISNFEPDDNFGNTFRVEESLLKVRYDAYDSFRNQFGHLFYKQKFSHYKLAIEYRFTGDQCPGGPGWARRNSGVMYHCQDPKTMFKNQDFPISLEGQFLGGLGEGSRPTANLCTPGTNVHMADTLFTPHCINSQSKTYDGDTWVSVEFLVLGDSVVSHFVGSEKVLEFTRPEIGGGNVNNYDTLINLDGTALSEGFIALQSESHPIEFRKVELLNLKGCKDPKARNYKSYYVVNDIAACRY
jgi:Domain of Unknown Function (DUF1080)